MFAKKQIAQPQRIGMTLRMLRESVGVSIEELAERTKLHTDSIYALETCAFHRLPQDIVYQKLYIKRYAIGLGVDPAPLLEQFTTEEIYSEQNISSQIHVPRRTKQWLRYRPALFSIGSGLVVLLCFMGYVGLQMNNLFKPPMLALTAPEDGAINEIGVTTVAGITDTEVSVFINGEQVRSAEDGQFHANVDLQPGVNTILVSAKKRHGVESNIMKYVLYRETTQVSLGDTPTHN